MDPDTIIVARIFVGRRLRSWSSRLGRRPGTIVLPDLCSCGFEYFLSCTSPRVVVFRICARGV